MTTHVNTGLKLYMQSAIATAVVITAATKANPGVLSAAGHTLVNGDVVLLEVQGMVELNKRLFVVKNAVAGTSFQVGDIDGTAGIDTTLFSTFSSGTARKITLGTSIPGCQDFNFAGGDIKTTDSTTVSDTVDTEIVTGASAMSADMAMQWDPSDLAQQAMRKAFDIRAERAFKVLWPDGAFVLWYGTVGYTMAPGGGKGGITTSPAKITMAGPLTVYAA